MHDQHPPVPEWFVEMFDGERPPPAIVVEDYYVTAGRQEVTDPDTGEVSVTDAVAVAIDEGTTVLIPLGMVPGLVRDMVHTSLGYSLGWRDERFDGPEEGDDDDGDGGSDGPVVVDGLIEPHWN